MNRKLMAVFVLLLSMFFVFVYVIAINFSVVKNRFDKIEPDLDNYSAAEILYLSFEKTRSAFLRADSFNNIGFKIKRDVLNSKINILDNHNTFSDAFYYDPEFASALSAVRIKNDKLEDVIHDYNNGTISDDGVLRFFDEMEKVIIDLQEIIYKVQIRNFNEVQSVIDRNFFMAQMFSVVSLALFLLIAFLMLKNTCVLKGIIKSKNLFISSIYHEIAASMQKIIMATELLDDEVVDGSCKKDIKLISDHSNKVISQTREILDYSRFELGGDSLSLTSFSIQDVVVEAISDVNNRGRNRIVYYDFSSGETLISDRYKLLRILVNLIDNACKFTCDGIVYVGVTNKEKTLKITVKDNGIGFDLGNMNEYYKAFNQGVKGVTKQGLGLGLTIVKTYVEALSGTIHAHSKPGGGASFTIIINKSNKKDI